jgi:cytochrome c oxidase assembly factor CtaG
MKGCERMRQLWTSARLAATAMLIAARVFAHGTESHDAPRGPRNWQELLSAWEWQPEVVIPLMLTAVFYVVGVQRTWRKAGFARGVTRGDVLCFVLGWLALVLALVSPLHAWGSMLFSAHMAQHEVLMLVAAPLLVLARPIAPLLRGLPRWASRSLLAIGRWTAWRTLWAVISDLFVAWLLHAVILWMWHIPSLFDATATSDVVHAAQHLSFFLSALLFWWAALHEQPRAATAGLAVLYMFTTAIHSGALGAIVTFAGTAWYASYHETTAAWRLTPLEDQQLGGLIMWIPACSTYIIAGLCLMAAWLRSSERRVQAWEARASLKNGAAAGLFLVALCSGCEGNHSVTDALVSAEHPGQAAIRRYGCGDCHTIPGVADANALVGPPLTHMASRGYIAGVMINREDNLIRWIKDPPAVDEKTAMPKLGVTDSDARAIANYLQTLR